MKVTFLGAAHEVTGSCTLLEVGDKKGVIDCGMEQGKDLFENQELPVAASVLDFALVTHAHVDHSGLLPLLYKNGFRGTVYATGATCSLLDIMLRDCANIQMSDAEWRNNKAKRSGAEFVEPLYDMEDAEGILRQMRPCPYNEQIQVNDCVTIRLTDVGHLLGSAAVELWLHENGEMRKITFSGDIGNKDQPILRDPQHIRDTEYLVMESTYGDRYHDAVRTDYVTELAARIQKAAQGISPDDMVEFLLMGEISPEADLSVSYLQNQIAGSFFFAKVKDETRLAVEPERYRNDVSLKGEFIRQVLASELTDADKAAVIRAGLQALSGEEISL